MAMSVMENEIGIMEQKIREGKHMPADFYVEKKEKLEFNKSVEAYCDSRIDAGEWY